MKIFCWRESWRNLEIGWRKCWGYDVSALNPLITFGHYKTITKHWLPIQFEHIGLSPVFTLDYDRHVFKKFGVCDVEKRLSAQPVDEHLP